MIPEVARVMGDPIEDVYVAIDVAIGRVLKRGRSRHAGHPAGWAQRDP
jgi:hypothetical protein